MELRELPLSNSFLLIGVSILIWLDWAELCYGNTSNRGKVRQMFVIAQVESMKVLWGVLISMTYNADSFNLYDITHLMTTKICQEESWTIHIANIKIIICWLQYNSLFSWSVQRDLGSENCDFLFTWPEVNIFCSIIYK